MKYLFLLFLFLHTACKCSKTNKTESSKSLSTQIYTVNNDSVPTCIKALIQKLESEPVTNPASKIYSYLFSGKTVYYFTAACCDNFSDLYDESCNIIAHPDGGFTGRGDGRLPTFVKEKTKEKLIWADKRGK